MNCDKCIFFEEDTPDQSSCEVCATWHMAKLKVSEKSIGTVERYMTDFQRVMGKIDSNDPNCSEMDDKLYFCIQDLYEIVKIQQKAIEKLTRMANIDHKIDRRRT